MSTNSTLTADEIYSLGGEAVDVLPYGNQPAEKLTSDPRLGITGPVTVEMVPMILARMEAHLAQLGDRLVEKRQTIQGPIQANLDSSGVVTEGFYTVREGFCFYLHRLFVSAQSSAGAEYTAASPYTNAAAVFTLRRNEEIVDFLPSTTIFPVVFAYDEDRAPCFEGGDRATISVTGGPASAMMFGHYQGVLVRDPNKPGEPGEGPY